ncbi:hypothetical protein CATRI_05925 [Corynebacterium atrinae]|uniref:hypothetical protein n=1 Tax=Corynebacterium atrinae TaxID=1336740 RepID=UPI0025B3CE81|nr:hypothetical protein [Corynebacterium atrinae]WJY63273.1 hypothetical protein CATRI_05925 [Corynebacterium atrinae]
MATGQFPSSPEDPETAEFAPQAATSAPQYFPESAPVARNRSGLAMVILAALVLGAVILGVWLYYAFLARDEAPVAAPPTTSTVVSTAAPSSSRTTTSQAPTTVTSSATPTSTTSTSSPSTEPVLSFTLPAGAEQCAANVNWRIFRASDATSCEFAKNVAIAMAGNSGQPTEHQVRVTSPVTGQAYQVRCLPEATNSFVCQGGDNALIVLEERAIRD